MDKEIIWNKRRGVTSPEPQPTELIMEHLNYIEKTVKEKLKNFYFNSDYKEHLAYIFEQMKKYDFSQFIPGVDVASDKEKGIIYINVYSKTND